jgi:predicted acylesterase/phospholipase RssA
MADAAAAVRALGPDDVASTRYMAFGGGGAAGILFIGAMAALERHGLRRHELRGAVGTSAGALFALATCAGTSYATLAQIVADDHGTDLFSNVDVARLVNGLGLDDGTQLRQLIDMVLVRSGLVSGTTFDDLLRLTGRQSVCVGTNLDRGEAFVWCTDSTPHECVADAMYASMCIPMMFVPPVFRGETHVDGCLAMSPLVGHFPLEQTLVLELRHPHARAPRSLQVYMSALSQLVMATVSQLSLQAAPAEHVHRIVVLEHDVVQWLRIDERAVDCVKATMVVVAEHE